MSLYLHDEPISESIINGKTVYACQCGLTQSLPFYNGSLQP
jgi:hypothetical protein